MNNIFRFFIILILLTGISKVQSSGIDFTKKVDLDFQETVFEGKPHIIIKTKAITWYFDKEGGGFSRMIDKDGNDWISFKREPWGEYPASAASAFRGIPNLVFQGDDGGAGHPGHDKCISTIEGDKIITESKSGKWKWSWEFFDDYAVLEMLTTEENQAYWFLYEGTPGGNYNPENYYFGTSNTPTSTELPDFYKGDNIFGNFRWIYCGNQNMKRTFYVLQLSTDEQDDLVGFLGNTNDGVNSPDGMTVFGFGRDKDTNPLLTGNQKFIVGFYPDKLTKEKKQKAFQKYLDTTFEIQ